MTNAIQATTGITTEIYDSGMKKPAKKHDASIVTVAAGSEPQRYPRNCSIVDGFMESLGLRGRAPLPVLLTECFGILSNQFLYIDISIMQYEFIPAICEASNSI
ncbi:hypothetical protein LMG29542_04888 [Paraburkholderia humisilvae]|uniref:Uncharacterized protein n=1 Tax=Paraburkholderia humisilvae TaxID=627669 RepID=A0A6J5EGA1_9BURK|nr:hypothetical protein LMG29542_04888 [Paraburkholderia humisilvae]